jgi:hypothetical protein
MADLSVSVGDRATRRASTRRVGGVGVEVPRFDVDLSGVAAGPAAAAHGDFVYNGGPVVAYPIIYPTFWGSKWSDAAHQPQAARLVQFLRDLVSSSYMNILTQYGVGTGPGSSQVLEPTFISNGVPATLTDAGIHGIIQKAIDTGVIDGPPPNNVTQVLVIFLDESVEFDDQALQIVMCEPNNDNAFGYHFDFKVAAGNECYYAVIPALDDTCIRNTCPNGCSLNLNETQEQRRTQVTSHEFSEMTTDPIFKKGWFGPSSDENGDICNGQTTTITVGTNTWNVQRMYSKTDDVKSNGSAFCINNAAAPIPLLSGAPAPWAHAWHQNDLTAATGSVLAIGNPSGYMFDAQGTQHVVYRGANDNHVHELWWNGAWHTNDLTVAAAAPATAGDATGYVFEVQGTQHVVYRGADNHVHELWWNGAWHTNDLTMATGAGAAAGDPSGYVFAAQGTQHVVYRGADNHVHELWWNGAWHLNDLTVAAGAPVAASDPSGYVFRAQGTQHVVYPGNDQHVHELWWNGTWHHNDLTVAAGAPAAASEPSGYVFDAQGTQHVNYLGHDQHVHELWWNGAWHHNDLTVAAGAGLAAGEPSGYMFDGQGTQHVVYSGADAHVHELWWNGAWHANDLTLATGAVAAASSPNGYVFDSQGTQHVVYRGADNHVHELWWS